MLLCCHASCILHQQSKSDPFFPNALKNSLCCLILIFQPLLSFGFDFCPFSLNFLSPFILGFFHINNCRGARFTTLQADYFEEAEDSESFSCYFLSFVYKNFSKGLVPRTELTPRNSPKSVGLPDVVGETWPGLKIRVSPKSQVSEGPVNTCLPNSSFAISMWIAFLPCEVPNHCALHPSILFDLQHFGYFGELLCFLRSLSYRHTMKLLFDFLLVICFM